MSKIVKQFGVEIECYPKATSPAYPAILALIETSSKTKIAQQGHSAATRKFTSWTATTDGSIQNDAGDRHPNGFEMCSPVLTSTTQARDVIKALLRHATTNKTCSVHVHWALPALPSNEQIASKPWKQRILLQSNEDLRIKIAFICKIYERYLFKMMAQSRQQNQYCRSIRDVSPIELISHREKYWSIRFSPETVEFRLHGATLSFEKIENWISIIEVLMNLVNSTDNLYTFMKNEGWKNLPEWEEMLDENLYEYYTERCDNFNNKIMSVYNPKKDSQEIAEYLRKTYAEPA